MLLEQVECVRPGAVQEALRLLAESEGAPLAGGQSPGNVLKSRVASMSLLADVAGHIEDQQIPNCGVIARRLGRAPARERGAEEGLSRPLSLGPRPEAARPWQHAGVPGAAASRPAARAGVAGLLLAAGAGRRLGRPKALVELGGELLVERGARLLVESGLSPAVVVLGASAEEVAEASLGPVRAVRNPGWLEGVGSSLRAGLDAVEGLEGGPAGSGAGAVVVALVDQPFVTSRLVLRLVGAWRRVEGAKAVVPTFQGAPGNPVLLDRSIWGPVREAASGDVGARAYLRGHPEAVVEIPSEDAGSPLDVDTEEDLRRCEEALRRGARWG